MARQATLQAFECVTQNLPHVHAFVSVSTGVFLVSSWVSVRSIHRSIPGSAPGQTASWSIRASWSMCSWSIHASWSIHDRGSIHASWSIYDSWSIRCSWSNCPVGSSGVLICVPCVGKNTITSLLFNLPFGDLLVNYLQVDYLPFYYSPVNFYDLTIHQLTIYYLTIHQLFLIWPFTSWLFPSWPFTTW